MTMNKRLLTTLMGMAFTVAMVAQGLVTPATGKYYKIVNQNPDKSVTTGGEVYGFVIEEDRITNKLKAVAQGDNAAYSQIWRCMGNGKFYNALTRRYIGEAYISQQMVTSTDEKAVSLVNKTKYFIIKSSNSNQLHADNGNNIVGWNDEGNKSNWWCFEEVTVDATALKAAQEKYDKEQDLKGDLEAIAARESDIAPIVEGYFSDGACTTLKPEFATLTDDEFRSRMTNDRLPAEVQNMVINIKNEWKNEFNQEMSKRFRVQNYKVYTRCSDENKVAGPKTKWVATQMSDMNNPTGIWTDALQLMYVFVEGDIPEGTTLKIAGASGSQITQIWDWDGVELHKGMNILYCGTDYTNQWIMYTCQANYEKPLSEYPDIKIHIEGGEVIGYCDVRGKDETAANNEYESTFVNAKKLLAHKEGIDYDNEKSKLYEAQRKINFNVVGERGVMVFPLECYDQIWSDRQWGQTSYGYKIYKSMKFYDNVLKWEWDAMGWQDDVEDGNTHEVEYLVPGGGEKAWPTYVNCKAPTMMLFEGKNPYSGNSYTCMPSIGAVESSYNGERANFDVWCVGHESGHNVQHTINLPSSMESSNNYFSNLITYMYGHRLSRGWNFNSNLQYVENKIIFSQRDISITLRMYYNLWLYYHRAGYNKQFTTKLHKLLRDDRMKFGGEGWYQGEKYGGDRGTADNSWLKFYEKACEAAGEDLTEYFRLWGFFIPTDQAGGDVAKIGNDYYAFCGDYSNYYIKCTQKMIDDAIARVKAKKYPVNKQILFIEDRLELQQRTDPWAASETDASRKFKPDNGGNWRTAEQLIAEYGNIGYVEYYKQGAMKMAVADDYAYVGTAKSIKLLVKEGSEKNGVGILVYDEGGNIIWYSNKFEFEIPSAISELNYTVKIINADGSEVVVKNAADSEDAAVQKQALEAAVEVSQSYLTKTDANGKKVGFYAPEVTATLKDLVAQANNAITAGDAAQYRNLVKLINAEIVNIDKNGGKIPLENNAYYTVRNYSRSHYLSTSTGAAESAASANCRWVMVPVKNADGEDTGSYYMQNSSTKKYISNVGDNGKFAVSAVSQADALKFTIREYNDEGAFGFGFQNEKDKTKYINETPTWNGIISWDFDGGSAWYIERYDYITPDVDLEKLNNLILASETLRDEVSEEIETLTKFDLQVTDEAAAYYLSSTVAASGSNTLDKAIDGSNSSLKEFRSVAPEEGVIPAFIVDFGSATANRQKSMRLTLTVSSYNKPGTVTVYGSNTTSANKTWTKVATYTGLYPTSTSKVEDLDISSSTAYRFWKFEYTDIKNEESGKAGVIRIAEFELSKLEVSFDIRDEYKNIYFETSYGSQKNAETLVSNCKTREQAATLAAFGEPSILNWITPYKNLLTAYEELKTAVDNATGITSIAADGNGEAFDLNGEAFDLAGRRVGKLDKGGIYIVGGKKLIK